MLSDSTLMLSVLMLSLTMILPAGSLTVQAAVRRDTLRGVIARSEDSGGPEPIAPVTLSRTRCI